MEGIWIQGHPATFATRREIEWKMTLAQALRDYSVPDCEGITLQFSLPTLTPNGQPVDIDNLCEPVFSVLAGKLGWFKSKRPNIIWWEASKEEKQPSGLMIRPGGQEIDAVSECAPDFYATYKDQLPTSARDPIFIEWVKSNMRPDMPRFSKFHIRLLFGGNRINIADISTGKVKSVIDCLYPVLGGTIGAPEDWRIEALEVGKKAYSYRPGEVCVMVWGYN